MFTFLILKLTERFYAFMVIFLEVKKIKVIELRINNESFLISTDILSFKYTFI